MIRLTLDLFIALAAVYHTIIFVVDYAELGVIPHPGWWFAIGGAWAYTILRAVKKLRE